jgi:hypothetical protein
MSRYTLPYQSCLSISCAAGVAFSKNVSSSTDNIGYIIPYPIVEHFLSEYRTAGAYQGVCSPGFYTQPMENPAQQHYLKVSSRSRVLSEGVCSVGAYQGVCSPGFYTQPMENPAQQQYLKVRGCWSGKTPVC